MVGSEVSQRNNSNRLNFLFRKSKSTSEVPSDICKAGVPTASAYMTPTHSTNRVLAMLATPMHRSGKSGTVADKPKKKRSPLRKLFKKSKKSAATKEEPELAHTYLGTISSPTCSTTSSNTPADSQDVPTLVTEDVLRMRARARLQNAPIEEVVAMEVTAAEEVNKPATREKPVLRRFQTIATSTVPASTKNESVQEELAQLRRGGSVSDAREKWSKAATTSKVPESFEAYRARRAREQEEARKNRNEFMGRL